MPKIRSKNSREVIVGFYSTACHGEYDYYHYTLNQLNNSSERTGNISSDRAVIVGLIPYTNYSLSYTWRYTNEESKSSPEIRFTTEQERKWECIFN